MGQYPHSVDVLEAAGLQTIANTIAKRRSNITQIIEGRQVLKECGGRGMGFAMNQGGGAPCEYGRSDQW